MHTLLGHAFALLNVEVLVLLVNIKAKTVLLGRAERQSISVKSVKNDLKHIKQTEGIGHFVRLVVIEGV